MFTITVHLKINILSLSVFVEHMNETKYKSAFSDLFGDALTLVREGD